MEILEEGKGPLFIKPDPDGDREFIRKNKSFILKDKLMSEQEAISTFVKDGDYVATELYGFVRAPMSLCREIVRQKKRGLKTAGQGIMELDIMIAEGCISAIDQTYIGYEVYGVSPVLRRAAEKSIPNKIEFADWSNAALAWRMKAASMGMPFIAVRTMMGTDTLKYSGAKVVKDPFTGKPVTLLPATMVDVGLIHVHRADKYGNCQIDGISGFAYELARASKRLIISAENIVDTEEIRKYPDRTIIPYYLVDAVVHAPLGAHPGDMCYEYWRDEPHLADYIEAAKTVETTEAYLNKYIHEVKNHEEYLELCGGSELIEKLRKEARGR
ncbi:MAG: CoA transferase subunit A [Candidatus Heimdallarchaeota archaeon]|nr:CoA transferase subunit A [Candidatus Heimdallarchaeota archaeon]